MTFNPYGPPGSQYPGQRPANDPWIQALVSAAAEFWGRRGVKTDKIDVDVADDVDDALAVGFNPSVHGQSRITLDGDEVGMLLANARNQKYSVRGRRRNLQNLGKVIFHEVGHVGGLEHGEAGLMDEFASEMPWDARVLSRKLIPREKSRKKVRKRPGGYGDG
jgi:hypothetical protein